jgi:predicted ATPase
VLQLAKLILAKTKGNPFYLHQYLAFIHDERFLVYFEETETWKFNVGEIQQQTMLPDDLADILELRVASLPPHVVTTLVVASTLGFTFEERVLIGVIDRLSKKQQDLGFPRLVMSEPTAKRALAVAVRIDMIEESTTGAGHYLFSHDKLLASFSNRGGQDLGDLAELHYSIAQCYLDIRGVDDEYTFLAADHANKSGELFQKHHGKYSLILLYLEAAAYSSKRSSFFDAATNLKKGLDLLCGDGDNNMWESDLKLSLELSKKLVQVELVLGNFDICEYHANEILRHTLDQETRITAMWYKVCSKVAQS